MMRDKLFMKKRNRIMLLTVMILAAVIVFLIIRLAGSGRDTGDENTMMSSDDEVQMPKARPKVACP